MYLPNYHSRAIYRMAIWLGQIAKGQLDSKNLSIGPWSPNNIQCILNIHIFSHSQKGDYGPKRYIGQFNIVSYLLRMSWVIKINTP